MDATPDTEVDIRRRYRNVYHQGWNPGMIALIIPGLATTGTILSSDQSSPEVFGNETADLNPLTQSKDNRSMCGSVREENPAQAGFSMDDQDGGFDFILMFSFST